MSAASAKSEEAGSSSSSSILVLSTRESAVSRKLVEFGSSRGRGELQEEGQVSSSIPHLYSKDGYDFSLFDLTHRYALRVEMEIEFKLTGSVSLI